MAAQHDEVKELAHRLPPYLLVAYLLALPSALIELRTESSADLVAYLKLACIIALAWHASALYRKRGEDVASTAALAALTGLVWSTALVIWLYQAVTMMPFNYQLAVASLEDSRKTIVMTLGEDNVLWGVLAVPVAIAAAIAGAWLAARAARRRILRAAVGPKVAVACAGALVYLVAGDAWRAAEELVLYPHSKILHYPVASQDHSAAAVRSNESVFILQLESVNAHAVYELSADGKSYRPRIASPGLEAILKEGGGVFFPFFWANGLQTNRAHESILCAISGNAGHALAFHPGRLARTTCLPRHLAGAGYATVFLYSFFELDFFNFREFHKVVGFGDVAHGPELMAETDRRYVWGYDDCVFYERAFDYLAKRGLASREKLFAYFEVSMHHFPFMNSKKYPQAHPFPQPASALEHYLNSLAEQDHCLRVFWKRFRDLGRDDIHLIIVPDHSVGVAGLGADPGEGFGVWFAYVPPARRKGEFRARTVLDPVPSQAQIYPTVLELLGAPRVRQSFAFLLQGRPPPEDYDSCHLLAVPYGGIVAVRDGERARLNLTTRELALGDEPPRKMDFWTFRNRYFCR